jgi:hypothetical protein
MAALAVIADDIKVKHSGGGLDGTFVVTTNETSCGRLNWDGVPDRTGKMSGGQYEITVQMVNNSVVLKELTLASHKGISSDITAKTTIPTNMIPWTGTVSQTTVAVFRVEQKMDEIKSPNKVPEPSVAPAPQVQH